MALLTRLLAGLRDHLPDAPHAIAPEALRVYTNLANAKKFAKADTHYENFIAASKGVDALSDHEKIGVYYALGKVYDDVGESRQAMEAFMAGAKLKRAELNYNKQASLYLFDRIREVFTKEALDAKRALFGELEDVVSADCILATNTSSMSVTTIAALSASRSTTRRSSSRRRRSTNW